MANEALFTAVFVYLLAAVISVAIFKRLGLSSVLGYLVAGIIIGPFGLGFVGTEGEDVMHFAEFGVVMMLFLVGLELQPALLWKLRGPILGLGGAQVLTTTAVIAGIGLATGLNWQMALAVGMSLALSSTAIVMQSLQEKGQMSSSGGRSAFSVLLFQDIAVIPMLALMPLLVTLDPGGGKYGGDGHGGHGGDHGHYALNPIQEWLSHQPGWVNTLMVLLAVVAIIVAGRTILRPVLRAVAQTRVREAFVALSLIIVIGIALLMTSLGVSAALGTFLAGVVLADSEYRHELEADIEPFKGLLLGVFFIAVGASVDFQLIAENPITISAVVIGLVVVKAIILFALGSIARLIIDQRMMFSLTLAQGSEFAFVLLGFALTAGVLDAKIVQILIASVAVTMALTPLIMILEEKVLRKRFGTQEKEERPADAMDEDAPVILAGVGRFGNFVARMLMVQKIGVTVIDSDPDHVEFLRKIGIKTFYGDISRHDLLESAGAHKAKLMIIAIDNEEEIERLVHTVKQHFPHLRILVRAQSRQHQYALFNEGVDLAVHQHSGSGVWLAEQAMVALGYRAHRAARAAKTFLAHDRDAVTEGAQLQSAEESYIEHVRERMAELESQFSEKEDEDSSLGDSGWDNTQLRKDTRGQDHDDVIQVEN